MPESLADPFHPCSFSFKHFLKYPLSPPLLNPLNEGSLQPGFNPYLLLPSDETPLCLSVLTCKMEIIMSSPS